LTAYATVYRYPGQEEPVSPDQLDEALRLAEAVYAWAQGLVSTDAAAA